MCVYKGVDLEVGQDLPGGFVVVQTTEGGQVILRGPYPFQVTFDCDEFEAGFTYLLGLLGIPSS